MLMLMLKFGRDFEAKVCSIQAVDLVMISKCFHIDPNNAIIEFDS